SPRLAFEFGVDVAPAGLQLTNAARTTIAASEASFLSAFQVRITPTLKPAITSTAEVHDGRGRRLASTAGFVFGPNAGRKTMPYVSFGGGLMMHVGDPATVTLV